MCIAICQYSGLLFYYKMDDESLDKSDAKFVDVIHTTAHAIPTIGTNKEVW